MWTVLNFVPFRKTQKIINQENNNSFSKNIKIMFFEFIKTILKNMNKTKKQNIGNYGYIGTCILQKYW